jgi:prevent-host-death family protein
VTSVGTFEAKTHLTRLLGRVAKGETIIITNRGRPVAMLVPPAAPPQPDVRRIVEEMLRIRGQQGPRLGKNLTIRQLIEEGRRF